MKRIYYLSTIIGAIGIVFLVFYFLRYRADNSTVPAGQEPPSGELPGTPPPTGEQNATTTPETQPPAEQPTIEPGEQKFGAVSKSSVVDYFVDGQNNAVITDPDGKIFKITKGEESALSSSLISNLSRVEFSHDGGKILAAFGSKTSPELSVFDVKGKSWSPLPAGIKYATWSPTTNQIAYLNGNSIQTLDIAAQNPKPQEIIKFGAEDMLLNWPAPNQMIMANRGTALIAGSLWSLNTQNKSLTPFVEDKLGLNYIWSDEAMMGLVFSTDASRRGGSLTLYDNAGNPITGLSFLTLPSKCAFDVAGAGTSTEKFLYCAIPSDQNQLRAKMLPDEYQKKAFFTSDNFSKINLTDGTLSEVFSGLTAQAGQNIDAENLKIFGGNLFFVNRYDGRLYAISLE